eukprot:XP_011663446.1 PREDICTED: tetraspanin-18 [Strongylocentrotus purpuratus]
MSTTPCGTFAKIVLFVVNFVFWLTGVAVLGIGIWVSVDRGTADFLQLFEDPLFKILGYSMIGIGGFVTLLGFIGCFGACHEHKWMVWLYFLIVLLLLLAEVVSTSLLFAFRSQDKRTQTTYPAGHLPPGKERIPAGRLPLKTTTLGHHASRTDYPVDNYH